MLPLGGSAAAEEIVEHHEIVVLWSELHEAEVFREKPISFGDGRS